MRSIKRNKLEELTGKHTFKAQFGYHSHAYTCQGKKKTVLLKNIQLVHQTSKKNVDCEFISDHLWVHVDNHPIPFSIARDEWIWFSGRPYHYLIESRRKIMGSNISVGELTWISKECGI